MISEVDYTTISSHNIFGGAHSHIPLGIHCEGEADEDQGQYTEMGVVVEVGARVGVFVIGLTYTVHTNIYWVSHRGLCLLTGETITKGKINCKGHCNSHKRMLIQNILNTQVYTSLCFDLQYGGQRAHLNQFKRCNLK